VTSDTAHDLAASFREHQRLLWGIGYRMTGSAAEAEDLVQEAYARALERVPQGELRPWLVTVVMNLARDHLRRRTRRQPKGPWLPEPVELAADGLAPGVAGAPTAATSPSARYELLESASFAFLVALETLSPQARAVMLLRDVFDYSVRETAGALEMSEANVKTTHHRARKQMRDYDEREVPGASLAQAATALQRFLGLLATGDVEKVERALAADAVSLSDGGKEYFAARVPLVGPGRIAKFYTKIAAMRDQSQGATFELRTLNGAPAIVATFDAPPSGQAPHAVMLADVDASGLITRIYTVLASEKVRALVA
jgi:RNA polymerase sigma-70 factor (ECF subfamily)